MKLFDKIITISQRNNFKKMKVYWRNVLQAPTLNISHVNTLSSNSNTIRNVVSCSTAVASLLNESGSSVMT